LKEEIEMALAQHISIQDTKKVNYQISHFTALLKRLWWHTKAYTAVFGVMLLIFTSLVFLYIHWFAKKLTQFFPHRTVIQQR
jgi:hypothetical protein